MTMEPTSPEEARLLTALKDLARATRNVEMMLTDMLAEMRKQTALIAASAGGLAAATKKGAVK